jgi:DSF synthase
MHSFPISEQYIVEFNESFGVLWSIWQAGCPPYFSPALLRDMEYGISTISDGTFVAADLFRYFVLRSRRENIFNLGGDLEFFRQMIMSGDRQGLLAYAKQSADMMYALHSGFEKGATTIALVQGKCIGGGFEAAVACDYIVAERHSEFCFPEIQLGIFPGMGALAILARRLDKRNYEEVCHSGRSFSAEELADKGLIDIVADTGQGEQAVMAWIKKRHNAFQSHQTMSTIRKSVVLQSRSDFQSALTQWTDVVMSLDKRRLALLALAIQKQRAESQ